jgi:hypothetical protein
LHTVVFGVNLPKGYIKQAKVLKGGYQFSLRVAVPKWFFEDSYFKKQRGYEDDRRHLGVQAHCRQVIQPVCQGYNALETLTSRSREVMKMTEGILECKPIAGKSSSLFVRGSMPLKLGS